MGAEASKPGASLAQAFQKLSTTDVESSDKLWKELANNKDDVYAGITAEQIRKVISTKPHNVTMLMTKLTDQLATLAKKPKSTLIPDEQKRAIALANIIARIIPFILEMGPGNDFHEQTFWKVRDNASAGVKDITPADSGAEAGGTGQPLAHDLLDAALALLFKPGFTCQGSEGGAAYWEGGISGHMGPADVSKGRHPHMDAGRAAFLKLVLVCCSGTLYVSPEQYKDVDNKWLKYITTRPDDFVTRFLKSLCNVILNYDPVGMGIPYASAVSTDTHEVVVDAALQTLLVCLDYKGPDAKGDAPAANGAPKLSGASKVATEQVPDTAKTQHADGKTGNAFRDALRGINEVQEFEMVTNGLGRLLNNPHQANNTLLPSSMKQIACFQELLMLFWKFIDENKNLLNYVLRAGDVNDLVVPMLYFMYEGRKDASKIGLIHICTFIMLLLSGERNFCVNLNAAFTKKLPIDLPQFAGNHADLTYIVLHKLLTDGPKKIESLYECFLTIMSNVSPYIKTFCMPAALRLSNLFELFANSKRLVAYEQYNRYLTFTLEVFNNVVQYQYEGNPHFIYQIIRRKKAFTELEALRQYKAVVPEGSDAETVARYGEIEKWVRGWASRLALEPCMRIMQHMVPQLEQFCESTGVNNETAVVEFLKTTTMVGLLPVPHAILIRKYQQNEYTNLWFATYLFGIIYLRRTNPPVFDATHIKLFTISYVDQ